MDETFAGSNDKPYEMVALLHRKLRSKAEALIILTEELEQCRNERDQFKLIAEQAQNQYLLNKTVTGDQVTCKKLNVYDNFTFSGSSFDHFVEVREQNKALRYEIQDLKQKLNEAFGDIKVLRTGTVKSFHLDSIKEITPAHQREELVEQLEQMSGRVTQLEADLRSVLDEKEELVTERESYRCKVHRLNHQINTLLKVDTGRVIDIDSLVLDNKYIQEQIQQLQVEKELAQQALFKYKNMLEKKRNKGIVKLGNNSSTMVVTHKQVQELLERGTTVQMPNTQATLEDLKSLCLALSEALQDKSVALVHQKKTNKILASRISELEHRLGTNVPLFPSELLLEGYSSAHVDTDLAKIQNEQIIDVIREAEPESMCCDKVMISTTKVSSDSSKSTNDSLPEDIQELVTQALEEIHKNESYFS